MSFMGDIQIIFEPYVYAYYYGPEGKKTSEANMNKLYDDFLAKTDVNTDKVKLAAG